MIFSFLISKLGWKPLLGIMMVQWCDIEHAKSFVIWVFSIQSLILTTALVLPLRLPASLHLATQLLRVVTPFSN